MSAAVMIVIPDPWTNRYVDIIVLHVPQVHQACILMFILATYCNDIPIFRLLYLLLFAHDILLSVLF